MALALLLALLAGLAASGLAARLMAGSRAVAVRQPAARVPVARLPAPVPAPAYDPHTLVVGYTGPIATLVAEIRARTHIAVVPSTRPDLTPHEAVLALPPATAVKALARIVDRLPHVSYALPDYIAHMAGSWYPDDTGRGHRAKAWEKLQWNFLAKDGIDAPEAWWNLLRDHRPGARGVVIAEIDTGVAYRNWRAFAESPDFKGTRFVHPCDLVAGTVIGNRCTDPYALDREGHGTFVAGVLAESTNNRYGLTGLAYQASIMPVRVLDAEGNGDATTIATGIRYAVRHHARVINLSIEFSPGTTSAEIPDIVSAITYAHDHGVVVVSAAGNDEETSLDYPAALPDVIGVGATTRDRCLAAYSDIGQGLDLVAPGGGQDAPSVPGSICHPNRNLPDIYQMTFEDPAHPTRFGLPGGWFGTSMAAPEVAAAAAMVIASRVLGPHPSPDAILARLEATAHPLGTGLPNDYYGYGLLDVGAATAPGGPLAPPPPTTVTTPAPTTTTAPAPPSTAPSTTATTPAAGTTGTTT